MEYYIKRYVKREGCSDVAFIDRSQDQSTTNYGPFIDRSQEYQSTTNYGPFIDRSQEYQSTTNYGPFLLI